MRKWTWRILLTVIATGLLFLGYRRLMPVYRVGYHSELVMLGDFNCDHQWSYADRESLRSILANPYSHQPVDCLKIDVNKNGILDPEDLAILERLFIIGDPYKAESMAIEEGIPFPRPRELYRYISTQDYLNRPLNMLPYPETADSQLDCLSKATPQMIESPYRRQLWMEIRDEAIRFDLAYRRRRDGLSEIEKTYTYGKILSCNRLYAEGRDFELLLELMGLVEDAETLTTHEQNPFVAKTLFFRDHLRELLSSQKFTDFKAGRRPIGDILIEVEKYLKTDLDMDIKLRTLGPPRDLKHLENYLSRAEWQYYKMRTKTDHFGQLIQFAQHDRRYLRAVSRTSRKHSDPWVQNHNLPMVLLFREALRISGGDKKAAVGLLDEAIRIPFFWVKSIPRDKLPGALALDNFLLPGNKEDGADKSRHWNVFGGICLYKSPQSSLELALKREMQDLRAANFSKECMEEFLRDTIANLNGIYYVASMDPDLLKK